MSPLRIALDRTLLLMRDELDDDLSDEVMLDALTGTTVTLVADEQNLASHSAQSAFITTALLAARSGHAVHLIAPNVSLVSQQPPLRGPRLMDALIDVGQELIPGIAFRTDIPHRRVDVEVRWGDSQSRSTSHHTFSMTADAWAATLSAHHSRAWPRLEWPLGGMACGGLAASELFKIAMMKLLTSAKNPQKFAEQFAAVGNFRFELAPVSALTTSDLGDFDLISAGAIAHAILYVLSRLPLVSGSARIQDDDTNQLSNMNRNALLLRSMLDRLKVSTLETIDLGGLKVKGVPGRYLAPRPSKLAARVLAGVDHIPTRWAIQRARPKWFGVGATSHWAAMASFHTAGLGCAGCLHPIDEPNEAAIPTVAFVSFWAGLMLSAYFIRDAAGERLSAINQHVFMTPLRPEEPWTGSVPVRKDCPAGVH